MRTLLKRTVLSEAKHDNRHDDTTTRTHNEISKDLRLLFLGCEPLPPYGPYEHTAALFMDLIVSAVARTLKFGHQRTVIIEVYGVSYDDQKKTKDEEMDSWTRYYPSETSLTNCDGVILPGSFSSAYDETKPWILTLKHWIQTRLVSSEIPTLGVCFGHQLYAHSFSSQSTDHFFTGGGSAVKCPSGPQAGRKTTTLTPAGEAFWTAACKFTHDIKTNRKQNGYRIESKGNKTSIDLFYTHGDMVKSLPIQAASIGGSEKVPIHAAIYFSTPVESPQRTLYCILEKNKPLACDGVRPKYNDGSNDVRVMAVTFQAHPEFSFLGKDSEGDATFHSTMESMKKDGNLSEEDFLCAKSDAIQNVTVVKEESLGVMIAAGRLFGWFLC